ncbi:zinc transporter ZupT [uncultured Methanofollis sp.]|uniref:zinc transporter ZupT n=1 Tax=uncultured Methanofollis sp. TaxID=262500 RepID=UPI0026168D07|nr:zinc transporter ZupT [uncultured Methanofollis sp.]
MTIDPASVWVAFGLTLLAGLSTGIGSLIVFFTSRTNTRLLSVGLGFSAGVMVYISFVEFLTLARDAVGVGRASVAFFGGMIGIAVIDRLVPFPQNPHEMRRVEEVSAPVRGSGSAGLYRTGIVAAGAIALHNMPEGMVTFSSALIDPGLGAAIAVAIAIHNIPEGIAVSVPIYYATGSRVQAFGYSLLSGIAEPVGALIVFLILSPVMDAALTGVIFAVVAGIMVFVALDELLPAAREYGEAHLSIYGLIAGMTLMAVVLAVM